MAGSAWDRAVLAVQLLAIDPAGLGGLHLRAPAGFARDALLGLLRDLLPADAPWKRVPLQIADERLLGGLDLAATLKAGRPVAERGVLAEVDGGVAVFAMAERLAPETAARIVAVLDRGEVVLARDGLSLATPTRLAAIALDEAVEADEQLPAAFAERLAFFADLGAVRHGEIGASSIDREAIAAARESLAQIEIAPEMHAAICGTALALGIGSSRADLLTLRAARASAALFGREAVTGDDVSVGCALVLAHRATQVPAPPVEEEQEEAPPPPPEQGDDAEPPTEQATPDKPLDDIVLEAAAAAIPPDLLARLKVAKALGGGADSAGKSGALQKSGKRGRPAGIFRGMPGQRNARLNLVATLRAAAPWQRIRAAGATAGPRVRVLSEDFRVTRFKQRRETTTIFAIDASGSAALHRLAETKGAVELLLADCYVRRDRVSVIAFRAGRAELVLPPTRSLVRAKRALAGLPGGGGTPLATGMDTARELAEAIRRQGGTPTLVLLTDGRANVTRAGIGGRDAAEADAMDAARRIRATSLRVLLVDTGQRPTPLAQTLSTAMGAVYLALPRADAATLNKVVRGSFA
ncbi:MAG: magnesium chelatase subunit D [Telmatospirillum sp.]|nr:magnesium chelatase subunit D [Telmatospirillum sp.]